MSSPIEFRETVTAASTGEGKFIRRVGGKGHYGHVILSVTPNARGAGTTIASAIASAIPPEFVADATEGVREGLEHGVLAGFRVVDVSVRITDASVHAVESSGLAFRLAARLALKDAMKNAKPILLV